MALENWVQAVEMVDIINPLREIEQNCGIEVGPFECFYACYSSIGFLSYRFIDPHFRISSDVLLTFNPPEYANELASVGVSFPAHLILEENRVLQRPPIVDENERSYPEYSFDWAKKEDGSSANLEEILINMGNDVRVTYRKHWNFNKVYLGLPTPHIPASDTLVPSRDLELLGRPIPWEIDFDDAARAILRNSRLEQLAQVLAGQELRW
jgi:hypothetical protein